MPDISMCTGLMCRKVSDSLQAVTLCPQRHNCYRFLAKPNKEGQSFLIADSDQLGKCEHYWEATNEVR